MQRTQSISKEERTKQIEIKLEKAVKGFKDKLHRYSSQKSKVLDKSCGNLNDPSKPQLKLVVPTSSGATQELENLNILSQENPLFLSQESQKLSQQSTRSIQTSQAGQDIGIFSRPDEPMNQASQQFLKQSQDTSANQPPQIISQTSQRPQMMQYAPQQQAQISNSAQKIMQQPSQISQILNNQFSQPPVMAQPLKSQPPNNLPQQQFNAPKNLSQYPQETVPQILEFTQPVQRQENNLNSDVNKKLADMKFITHNIKTVKNQNQFLKPKPINNGNSENVSGMCIDRLIRKILNVLIHLMLVEYTNYKKFKIFQKTLRQVNFIIYFAIFECV